MSGILKKLADRPFMEFHDLFHPEEGLQTALVNYLAILELAKEGLIRITQAAPFAPLYVMAALTESRALLTEDARPMFELTAPAGVLTKETV